MRHHVKLIQHFVRASLQQETAYRANFFIGLLHALLNVGTGALGVMVLFGQVETVRGWDFPAALAVLGIYLTVSALRDLFIAPSLDALGGLDGMIWSGRLDYALLRPVHLQFLVTFQQWRLFSLFDLALGLGVLGAAATRLSPPLTPERLAACLILLCAGMMILYAILLAFTGLMFWSPGVLFTWVFNGIFQMARYPVGLYPGWLRLALTWVIPVGVIVTVPAEALAGSLPTGALLGSPALAGALFVGASALFRAGVRRYASASS